MPWIHVKVGREWDPAFLSMDTYRYFSAVGTYLEFNSICKLSAGKIKSSSNKTHQI